MYKLFILSLIIALHSVGSDEHHYHYSFDVHGLMEHVLYPSSAVIWQSAGSVITLQGEQSLAPTTEQEWHNVEDHAAIIMETSNLLIMPGRGPNDEEWIALSQQLITTGGLAFKAAQARDSQALFDAGGALYQSCLACHEKYLISDE